MKQFHSVGLIYINQDEKVVTIFRFVLTLSMGGGQIPPPPPRTFLNDTKTPKDNEMRFFHFNFDNNTLTITKLSCCHDNLFFQCVKSFCGFLE